MQTTNPDHQTPRMSLFHTSCFLILLGAALSFPLCPTPFSKGRKNREIAIHRTPDSYDATNTLLWQSNDDSEFYSVERRRFVGGNLLAIGSALMPVSSLAPRPAVADVTNGGNMNNNNYPSAVPMQTPSSRRMGGLPSKIRKVGRIMVREII